MQLCVMFVNFYFCSLYFRRRRERSGSRSSDRRNSRRDGGIGGGRQRRSRSRNRSGSKSRNNRSRSRSRGRKRSRSDSRSPGVRRRRTSPDISGYGRLNRTTIVYATSLAAELRKKQKEMEVNDTKRKNYATVPKPTISNESDPIIIDDPEDDSDSDSSAHEASKSIVGEVSNNEQPISDIQIDASLLESIPLPLLPETVPETKTETKAESNADTLTELPSKQTDSKQEMSPVTQPEASTVTEAAVTSLSPHNLKNLATNFNENIVITLNPFRPVERQVQAQPRLTSTTPALATMMTQVLPEPVKISSPHQTLISVAKSSPITRLTSLPMPPIVPDEELDSLSEDIGRFRCIKVLFILFIHVTVLHIISL